MDEEKIKVDINLVVDSLLKQIAKLSKENATNYALAVKYKAELNELKEKKR